LLRSARFLVPNSEADKISLKEEDDND